MAEKIVPERAVFKAGDIVDNRYFIRKTLGEGSFGAVYLADDQRKGQSCALKVLRLWDLADFQRKEPTRRFDKEYAVGRIDMSCDCLVHSWEKGMVNGNPYFTMELCPGGDLTPLLGKAGPRAAAICYDILVGLNALHSRGIVHRDLKPENVLFKTNGHAALTDFGIVGDKNNSMTALDWRLRPQEIFGTHAYMAPEQRNRARGGITRLPTSDMFSFGVLAFQLLTGQLPFGRLETFDDLPAYVDRLNEGTWDYRMLEMADNGQNWTRLIGACLKTDYSKRINSAKEAARMLPPFDRRPNTPAPVGRPKPSPADSFRNWDTSYRPAPVTHGYRLRVLQGDEPGRVYELKGMVGTRPKTLFTLGRLDDNDVCIRDEHSDFLSRHHCTIEANRDCKQWSVRDGQWDRQTRRWKESRNGTYANSRPVSADGYYLMPGDIITVGDVTLRFENY